MRGGERMGHKLDLTGQRFGKLVAVEIAGVDKKRNTLWKCQCDCGNITTTPSTCRLRKGKTKSCGCLSNDTLISWGKSNDNKEGTKLSTLTSKLSSVNTSGAKGVYWHKGASSWTASITVKGKNVYLGLFINKQDAIDARKAAEDKYFKPMLNKYKDIKLDNQLKGADQLQNVY